MTKKSVIYCRTAIPDAKAIARQEMKCRRTAKRFGYRVNRVFVDNGQSGRALERPGLGALIVFCLEHPELVTTVLVTGYDRLARHLGHLFRLHDCLQGLNISIQAGPEPASSAASKLPFGIVRAVANYEKDARAEHIRYAKHRPKTN